VRTTSLGRVALAGASLVSLALLAAGIYPGILADLTLILFLSAFVFSIVLIPIGILLAIAGLIMVLRQGGMPRLPLPWKHLALAAIIIIATAALLALDLPARLAFAAVRTRFESLALAQQRGENLSLPQRLGPYRIDHCASDPRGGTYFRIYRSRIPLGPDTISFGFAHQPNPIGSPYGRAGYTLSALTGDWHIFRASNDYH
jgi:hypothetical protein